MPTTAKKKPRVKITAKQHALAGIVLEAAAAQQEKTKTQMLVEAGYKKENADVAVVRAFKAEGFLEALRMRGAEDKLQRVIEDAMDAKQGSWFQGEFYQDESADHQTRLKAGSLLADILGIKKQVIESKSVNVNVDGQEALKLLGLG